MSANILQNRDGFALRELLVLSAIAATGIGLACFAVQKVRDDSARTATIQNLAECAKAVHRGHDMHKKFPPYFGAYDKKAESHSFHVHLLPFVDQAALYANPAPTAVVPTYLSMMDPSQTGNGANGCNYAVNLRLFYTDGGLGTLTSEQAKNLIYPKMPGSFPDGVSATLLFATKYMNCGANGGSWWLDPGYNAPTSPTAATFGSSMSLWQVAPTRTACDPTAGTAQSFSAPAIQVAMCDGSVRSVTRSVDSQSWQAVHTPGGLDNPDTTKWCNGQ